MKLRQGNTSYIIQSLFACQTGGIKSKNLKWWVVFLFRPGSWSLHTGGLIIVPLLHKQVSVIHDFQRVQELRAADTSDLIRYLSTWTVWIEYLAPDKFRQHFKCNKQQKNLKILVLGDRTSDTPPLSLSHFPIFSLIFHLCLLLNFDI